METSLIYETVRDKSGYTEARLNVFMTYLTALTDLLSGCA